MTVASVAAFWAVSMVFVITPGVDWAYAMAAGSRRQGVFWSVTGMLAGHFAATLAVAAGLAALLAASPPAMRLLTIAGSFYLVWLGVGSLRHSSANRTGPAEAPDASRRQFLRGVGVSLLNPKVFLLFLALLPQFVTPGVGWPVALQLVALGIVHVMNCALVYFPVGYGAGAVLSGRPRATQVANAITGAVLVTLGCALLVEQFVLHS